MPQRSVRIQALNGNFPLALREHAIQQMVKRGITQANVDAALGNGAEIEDYQLPFPFRQS